MFQFAKHTHHTWMTAVLEKGIINVVAELRVPNPQRGALPMTRQETPW